MQFIFTSTGIDYEKTKKWIACEPGFDNRDTERATVFTFRLINWKYQTTVQLSPKGNINVTVPEPFDSSTIIEIKKYLEDVFTQANGDAVELFEDVDKRHVYLRADVKVTPPAPPSLSLEDRKRAELNGMAVVEAIVCTDGRVTLECLGNGSLIYGIYSQAFEKPVSFQLLIQQAGTVCGTVAAGSLGPYEFHHHGSWRNPIGTVYPSQVITWEAQNNLSAIDVASIHASVVLKRFEP